MKIIFRILLGLLILFVVYIAIVLVHGTVTEFKPEVENSLTVIGDSAQAKITDSVLNLVIWNIGYAGLGEESSFFYDDGSMLLAGDGMVRPAENIVEKNVEGILGTIQSLPVDFYLLQEVDRSSKRSYKINQYEEIHQELGSYAATFAVNYRSPRVPLPLLEPWRAYGKVESGLATYSRYLPASATRYQLPGEYAWPTRIFQLDRCAAVHRFPYRNGKELAVFNIHNSAYDKGGKLKAQQMAFLKELFLKEYETGNHVIAGGDWNQCPPYFQYDRLMPGKGGGYSQINIAPEFLPEDWRWVYDARTPTNRKVAKPYKKGETFITIIDFFLLSPNVKVRSVKAIDKGFQFSDHQPVWIEVELL